MGEVIPTESVMVRLRKLVYLTMVKPKLIIKIKINDREYQVANVCVMDFIHWMIYAQYR